MTAVRIVLAGTILAAVSLVSLQGPASAGCGTLWQRGSVDNESDSRARIETRGCEHGNGWWRLDAGVDSSNLRVGGQKMDVDNYDFRVSAFKHDGKQKLPWAAVRIRDWTSKKCDALNIREGGVFLVADC